MELVVGVKRVKRVGGLAAPEEEAEAAINAMWVTLGGVEILPESLADQLVSARASIGADHIMEVTIQVVASGFRTADWKSPDAPERFRTDG